MNNDVKREEQIFEAALQFPTPDLRAAYAKGACGNDEKLCQRIEALLKAHEHSGGFLDRPPAVTPAKTIALTTGMLPVTEKPGDKIGRYKVLQQIGEGGCGVVYMAEQEEPVRRRVALKVIKLGMDTKSVIARFEAERQALALMDHSTNSGTIGLSPMSSCARPKRSSTASRAKLRKRNDGTYIALAPAELMGSFAALAR